MKIFFACSDLRFFLSTIKFAKFQKFFSRFNIKQKINQNTNFPFCLRRHETAIKVLIKLNMYVHMVLHCAVKFI